jgi:hypothetical protein
MVSPYTQIRIPLTPWHNHAAVVTPPASEALCASIILASAPVATPALARSDEPSQFSWTYQESGAAVIGSLAVPETALASSEEPVTEPVPDTEVQPDHPVACETEGLFGKFFSPEAEERGTITEPEPACALPSPPSDLDGAACAPAVETQESCAAVTTAPPSTATEPAQELPLGVDPQRLLTLDGAEAAAGTPPSTLATLMPTHLYSAAPPVEQTEPKTPALLTEPLPPVSPSPPAQGPELTSTPWLLEGLIAATVSILLSACMILGYWFLDRRAVADRAEANQADITWEAQEATTPAESQ